MMRGKKVQSNRTSNSQRGTNELMRMGLYNYDLGLFENRVPGNSLVYQPSEMHFSGWTHFQTNPFGEL
jgi:hypothetical protein